MKKGQLIELLESDMVGGNPTPDTLGKAHPERISLRAAYAYERLLLEVYQSVKRSKDFRVFDTLTKKYTADVKCEDYYYSEIPASFVAIPNTIAIRNVTTDRTNQISLVDGSSIPNIDGCIIGSVSDTINAYFRHNKLIYHRMDESIKKVNMDIVVSFDEYEDNEHIPVPVGMKGNIYDLLKSRIFMGINEDKINNDLLDKSGNNE